MVGSTVWRAVSLERPCRSRQASNSRLRLLMVLAGGALFGADDREVLVDEYVVGPVDADDMDVVIAAAHLHHAVDGASRVCGERSGLGFVRGCPGDDRA